MFTFSSWRTHILNAYIHLYKESLPCLSKICPIGHDYFAHGFVLFGEGYIYSYIWHSKRCHYIGNMFSFHPWFILTKRKTVAVYINVCFGFSCK